MQTVEVTLRNGIVFMIVAARTTDGEAEKDLSNRAGQFVQNILPQLRLEIGVRLPGPHTQETESN